MKYNEKEFTKAVNYYKKGLPKNLKGKTILIYFQLKDEKQFYSIAPLSRAVHELKGDLVVSIRSKKEHKSIEALFRVWDTFDAQKKGVKNEKTKALSEFIGTVNKKVKNKKFNEVFERPYMVFTAGKKGFESENSFLEYNAKWFRKYKWKALVKTARALWKNSYDLKGLLMKGVKLILNFQKIFYEYIILVFYICTKTYKNYLNNSLGKK